MSKLAITTAWRLDLSSVLPAGVLSKIVSLREEECLHDVCMALQMLETTIGSLYIIFTDACLGSLTPI